MIVSDAALTYNPEVAFCGSPEECPTGENRLSYCNLIGLMAEKQVRRIVQLTLSKDAVHPFDS